MKKLIAAYIIENEVLTLSLSIQSVINHVDSVIIIDGGSKDGTLDLVTNLQKKYPNKIKLYCNDYEHNNKGANGKQRNKYLEIIKQDYPNDWCLVLDSDELVDEKISNLKSFLKSVDDNKELKDKDVCVDLKMVHFVQDLAHEDNMFPEHRVHHRLFRISDDLYYNEVEHPVLSSIKPEKDFIVLLPKYDDKSTLPIVWHLGYSRDVYNLRKKYLNHLEKSNMHTPEYLYQWYICHLFGKYPKREVSIFSLPKILKDYFLVPEIDDAIYFSTRCDLEVKHFIDSKAMIDLFSLNKDSKVLFAGDGMGMRTYAMLSYGIDARGFDISKYAIEKSPYKAMLGDKLFFKDLTSEHLVPSKFYDLVIAYDVLEHLQYKDLNMALTNIKVMSKKDVLFSIPFKGDPNLENDPTHIIKESREWWVKQIEDSGIKIKETPQGFPYEQQILIGEVN